MAKQTSYLMKWKDFTQPSVFTPENLLRESAGAKKIGRIRVPEICVLDPDGDIVRYLRHKGSARKSASWACYHTDMYIFKAAGTNVGIVPCAVGAPFAVLVAEQMKASGCRLLLSVTSAGRLTDSAKKYILITSALRDEGTSHHYAPVGKTTRLHPRLERILSPLCLGKDSPVRKGISWTTDAPYRETRRSIAAAKEHGAVSVEMEAAALYSYAESRDHWVVCFAQLTNTMAQQPGDFEKGKFSGAVDSLDLISGTIRLLRRSLNEFGKRS